MSVLVAVTAVLLTAPAGVSAESGDVTIKGVVLDAAGLPLADVCLGLMRSDGGSFDVFDAPFPPKRQCTGEDGTFSMNAAPGHVAVIAARYQDAITLRLTPAHVTPSGARVVVRFDGAASIRMRAVDEAGLPLAKVRVTALPERTGAAAARGDATVVRGWTAQDGTFVFNGLAPGEHRILAYGAGHRCIEACEYGKGMRIRTGPTIVNVPLSPLGSVTGRVVHHDGAAALQLVPEFLVWSPAFGSVRVQPEDGRFDIEVPRLWAGAPLFVVARGLAPFATRFDLKRPVAVDLGDVVLGVGRAVRGRVSDASGNAVQGAAVRVGFAPNALPEPLAVTDATGAFEIVGVSEGAAALTVAHPGFRPTDVVVAPGAAEVDVRLSAEIALSVRVEDVDGTPLARAEVWDVISRTRCQSGADGTCILSGLEEKEQVLEARLPGAPRPQAVQLRVPIAALTGGQVTMRLPRRPSLLRITPVGPDGTFAQANVVVLRGEISPERAVNAAGNLEQPYHASGVDMEKRFPNLPPGRYTIVAREFANRARCTVHVVELAEEADQRVVVKLPADRGPCRPDTDVSQ